MMSNEIKRRNYTSQHTFQPWLLCNHKVHIYLHGGSGDPPDSWPCLCGKTTYGDGRRKVAAAERGHASYVLATKPMMHAYIGWLLLTLTLVALVLAGSVT